jgi:ribose 5-phosphate isomerase
MMATSLKMEAHTAHDAFPMLALAVATEVHLYIDEADEVAPDLNLVKGRACSLLREKVIEAGRRRPLRLHRR